MRSLQMRNGSYVVSPVSHSTWKVIENREKWESSRFGNKSLPYLHYVNFEVMAISTMEIWGLRWFQDPSPYLSTKMRQHFCVLVNNSSFYGAKLLEPRNFAYNECTTFERMTPIHDVYWEKIWWESMNAGKYIVERSRNVEEIVMDGKILWQYRQRNVFLIVDNSLHSKTLMRSGKSIWGSNWGDRELRVTTPVETLGGLWAVRDYCDGKLIPAGVGALSENSGWTSGWTGGSPVPATSPMPDGLIPRCPRDVRPPRNVSVFRVALVYMYIRLGTCAFNDSLAHTAST